MTIWDSVSLFPCSIDRSCCQVLCSLMLHVSNSILISLFILLSIYRSLRLNNHSQPCAKIKSRPGLAYPLTTNLFFSMYRGIVVVPKTIYSLACACGGEDRST